MEIGFDYLVNVLHLLDDKEYRYKSDIPKVAKALTEKAVLIQSGLVDYYQKRTQYDNSVGRFRKCYRLTKPYTHIKIRDLITPTFPRKKFERHIFRKLGLIKLTALDNVVLPPPPPDASRYSAERLIRCLGCLSTNYFTPVHPRLYRVSPVARKIMTDMVAIGLVMTRNNGSGLEYKLCVPLTEVTVEVLLPYLYSASPHRQYHNRLFLAVKDFPISALLTSY